VTLIGRPNVGKSTLLNSLIGQQISITADKPQTTRNNIRGIINESDYPAIVLDTPGIHLPRNELHKRIVGYALQTIKESDLIFFITEPLSSKQEEIDKGDEEILKQFDGNLNNAVLVINKIDLAKPEDVLRTIALFNKRLSFLETVPISALKRKGTETLVSFFPKYLPEGVPYFDQDQLTDTPERVIVGEFVREQIMRNCFQEVPYGVAVVVDAFKEGKEKIKIFATIFVERESHKRIIIGKQGSMLKKLGQYSRQKIERLLGTGVYLSLHVKVAKNWINNPGKLNEFGYSK
ncbi:MAG: GTPase Era, partial [Proteobacteria bacterium]|nr:GTPase Era [Pseudomonadota bacterium]